MLNVSLATTSPATKSISGSPSDCASITCNLTIIIDNINHYNHSGHSILGRPGASAAEYSGRNTKNYFCDGKYFADVSNSLTKLILTITVKALCFCGGIYATNTKNYFCDGKYFCRCI